MRISSNNIKENGANTTVSATFEKSNQDKCKCTILAAVYDTNDSLIKIQSENFDDIPNSHSFVFDDENIKSSKIFVWDALDGMKPLAKSKVQYVQ